MNAIDIVCIVGVVVFAAVFSYCLSRGSVSIFQGRYASFIAWMFYAISPAVFAVMFLTGDYSPLEKELKVAISAALTVTLASLIIAFIVLAVLLSLFLSLTCEWLEQ